MEPCPGLPDQRRDGGGYELSAVPLAPAHVQQNDEQRKGGEASGSGAVLQRCGGGGPLKLLMSRLFFGKGRRRAHEGSDFLKVLPLLLMLSLRPLRQMEKHLVHAFDVFQSRLGQDHTFVSSSSAPCAHSAGRQVDDESERGVDGLGGATARLRGQERKRRGGSSAWCK